jgi:DNA-binding response OmpR family regulator
MEVYKVLIYSVNNSNIEFYKKSLVKINCKITIVFSFIDFERFLLNEKFDLILSDLELDNTDAITVIKEIKALNLTYNPYLIICSAKNDDFIQISALNSGADDFVELPINPLIFESKLIALLKRINPTQKQNDKAFFYIDREGYKIVIGKNSFSLPRLEFRLVDLLLSNPDKIFSKDEIANEIWHNKDVSSKRTIDIHIRNIRKELGAETIKTYRGLGYSIRTKKEH